MSSHIEYQKFRHGDFCVEDGCRARKFYIEDGKKFCQRGHEQTGFTQTQQDEDDWKSQGKKFRRQRREEESTKTVLTGSDSRELYLQCFQLVLWKQVRWLIIVKKLPPELETVVRDLWGLRLSALSRAVAERAGYSSGTGTQTMFSSTSEGEATDTDGSGFKSASSRRSRKQEHVERLPKLAETLALLYLGMILMRVPVSLGDLMQWAKSDDLLYNRAMAALPKEMREALPPHLTRSLEVRSVLSGRTFNKAVLQLVRFFHKEFDMVFPPITTPVLLYKHVRDLGLPVEIYAAVQRLSSLLDLDFTHTTSRNCPIIFPEVQLMVLIIIATKLCQPFDGIKRIPEHDINPSALVIDWREWNKIMEEPDIGVSRKGEAMGLKDTDVMTMSGQNLDDYMDWFQRTWLEDKEAKMPASILDMFALTDVPSRPATSETEEQLDRLKRVHQSMTSQETQEYTSSKFVRPGGNYRRYKKIDDVPEEGRLLFKIAADNVGMSVQSLIQRTYEIEGRLIRWNLEERRLLQATGGGGTAQATDDSDDER